MNWLPSMLRKATPRMVEIKSDAEVQRMRVAGLIVADALSAVRAAVAPGVSTLELDTIAEDVIRSAGAAPNFMLEPGYHHTLCTSVNDEVVHGIPRADKILTDGDIVSVDCGAIIDGWNGDAAITVPVGEISRERQDLIDVTEASMWAGFAAARLGGRLTDISHGVETCIEEWGTRHGRDYGIVENYGGHGIGRRMHEDPHVLNYGPPGRGHKLVRGLTLAIEPMVTLGSPHTRELADGWTVVSTDGSWAAHVEHTFVLTTDGPWVLTAHDGGRAALETLGVKVSSQA